ncbi:MAG: MarR family transcriptional regulator [Clostridia bacterium]|nr:MarR family transcriptional regulator [Clostridia bacterium]MBR1683673.1 MarR family transcriptional regulator [Clostridia bacterium]MBR2287286.1 MarR family transcriptional regulator [Clostridia bacterium]
MSVYPERTDQLCRLYYDHLRAVYRYDTVLSREGEDAVVMCLYYAGSSMLAGEIKSCTGLTTGRVANILRQLEAKAHIERRQDPEDRRRVHVHLTEKGLARAEQLQANAASVQSQLFRFLGENDALELERILGRCLTFAEESPQAFTGS